LLSAVLERERTGKGRHLDVALADAGLAFLQPHLATRLAMGEQGRPLERGTGMLNGGGAGYRLYRTRDGRALSVGALEPKFWIALCDALGAPHLTHLAYSTGTEGERVAAELAAILAQRTLAEWETFLADRDLCCEPVREGDEVLADAFVAHRGFLRQSPLGLELVTPIKLDPPPQRRSPELGEHTDEVLRACGIDPARLDR
jgi:crotonobetainyl-CoA:carnitine CoA-transferase CaiB-like acyl-CoA transferase